MLHNGIDIQTNTNYYLIENRQFSSQASYFVPNTRDDDYNNYRANTKDPAYPNPTPRRNHIMRTQPTANTLQQ